MKRIVVLTGLFMLIAVAISCNKEENAGKVSGPQEWPESRDSVSLKIKIAERSASKAMAVDDSRVEDINLYLFNAAGEVQCHKYVSGVREISGVKVCKGESCSIYLLANAGASIPLLKMADLLQLKLSAKDISQIISGNGAMIMTGSNGPVVPTEETTLEIELKKALAKIVVKSNMANLSEDVNISIKRISLKQAPSTITPFAQSRAGIGEVMDGESVALQAELDALSGEGVKFYLWENMQGVVAPGATDNKSKESLMEQEKKSLSTYIEMVYDYISPLKRGEITYRFYLGKGFTDCNICRNTEYLCTVYFRGNGSADENSWSVDTSQLDDVPQGPAVVAFEQSERVLYRGEVAVLNYSQLSPASAVPALQISDESLLEVVESTSQYVKVRSLANGSAVITATNGEATASCNIRVEEARIELPESITLYKQLPKVVEYNVLPASAKVLPLEILLSSAAVTGSFSESADPSSGLKSLTLQGNEVGDGGNLTIRFKDLPDISASADIAVKPTISMSKTSVDVIVNRGNEETVVPLEIETDPDYRHLLEISWIGSLGAPDCTVDLDGGSLRFANPSSSNGNYSLKVSLAGGLGDSAGLEVNIYEMVYIVAFSRTLDSEVLEKRSTSMRVGYNNEIKIRWFSNPRTILFSSREELYNICDYTFRGVGYTAADADDYLYETKVITFNNGSSYPMVDGSTFTFNINRPENYPELHIAYYQVDPAEGERYKKLSTGEYIYIYSLTFANGLADKEYEWREVFNRIYP